MRSAESGGHPVTRSMSARMRGACSASRSARSDGTRAATAGAESLERAQIVRDLEHLEEVGLFERRFQLAHALAPHVRAPRVERERREHGVRVRADAAYSARSFSCASAVNHAGSRIASSSSRLRFAARGGGASAGAISIANPADGPVAQGRAKTWEPGDEGGAGDAPHVVVAAAAQALRQQLDAEAPAPSKALQARKPSWCASGCFRGRGKHERLHSTVRKLKLATVRAERALPEHRRVLGRHGRHGDRGDHDHGRHVHARVRADGARRAAFSCLSSRPRARRPLTAVARTRRVAASASQDEPVRAARARASSAAATREDPSRFAALSLSSRAAAAARA